MQAPAGTTVDIPFNQYAPTETMNTEMVENGMVDNGLNDNGMPENIYQMYINAPAQLPASAHRYPSAI